MVYTGHLHKMRATLATPIEYELTLGYSLLKVNDLLGKKISFTFQGIINCKKCGRKTKKSFAQGFCYPCFMTAPESSPCIIKPELCEAHLGKGRDIAWEKAYHLQPHIVYLALSSAVKVGVTRDTQIPTRWIDQGAWQAIILAEVPYRQLAGELEVALKSHLTDKTNWQKMLKNTLIKGVDIAAEKARIKELIPSHLQQYFSLNNEATTLEFPVLTYPKKVKSINLDKIPTFENTLVGIKGQYLIFEDGSVLNIRKYSGYLVEIISL